MEDFYDISWTTSYNDSDHRRGHDSYDYILNITDVLICVIFAIGLPLTLVAIYGFYSLVRKNEVAPVYIINLLIADLIQLCCMIAKVVENAKNGVNLKTIFFIHSFALSTSIGFMLCISMERYLVVAWPLWYRFRRNIKTSAVICVMVWTFPNICILPLYLWADYETRHITCAVFFLLPLPLFIFFLVGTCKALSTSSVPSKDKRRIVAVLVLVLLIYILLFLPRIISYMRGKKVKHSTGSKLDTVFIRLNPLADLFLYVFSRKGAVDKLLASLCCCSVDSNDINISTEQQLE